MEKLTYKDNDNSYKLLRGRECQWKKAIKEEYSTIDNSIQKLGKLEDLEEKIGCPLDVYYKLHNQAHIYDPFGTPLKILRVLADTVAVRPEKFLEGHCFFHLADYKKTWFLKKDKSE